MAVSWMTFKTSHGRSSDVPSEPSRVSEQTTPIKILLVASIYQDLAVQPMYKWSACQLTDYNFFISSPLELFSMKLAILLMNTSGTVRGLCTALLVSWSWIRRTLIVIYMTNMVILLMMEQYRCSPPVKTTVLEVSGVIINFSFTVSFSSSQFPRGERWLRSAGDHWSSRCWPGWTCRRGSCRSCHSGWSCYWTGAAGYSGSSGCSG